MIPWELRWQTWLWGQIWIYQKLWHDHWGVVILAGVGAAGLAYHLIHWSWP